MTFNQSKLAFLAVSLSILLAIAGCARNSLPLSTATQEQAAATPLPPATETPRPMPPTYTLTPSPTVAPTLTPTPTWTPSPTLPPAVTALSAWCMPENVPLPVNYDPAQPPENARAGIRQETRLEIRNLPASTCVFIYTYSQAAPSGLKLAIYDTRKDPWLTADLLPVKDHPDQVYAVLRHSYIVAPPLWQVTYQFALNDSTGSELRRDEVLMKRWQPKLCWNGAPPNVLTMRCPLPLDLHPWDIGYLTPIVLPTEGN